MQQEVTEDAGADEAVIATEAAAETKPVAAGKRPRAPGPRESPLQTEERLNDERTLRQILEQLGGGVAFRIAVSRTSPQMFQGRNVGGLLHTYEDVIDEQGIKDAHGGGKYHIKVTKQTPSGSYTYAGHRTVTIAGDPLIETVRDPGAVAAPVALAAPVRDPLVDKAWNSLEERDREQRRKIDELAAAAASGQNRGFDPVLLETIIAPHRMAAQQAAEANRRLEDRLAAMEAASRAAATAAVTAAATPSAQENFKDKLLDKMFDGENARITNLRLQFDSELNQVKNARIEDEKRLRDQAERELASVKRDNENRIAELKAMHQMNLEMTKGSMQQQIDFLKLEAERLKTEHATVKAEVVELRAKKDKSLGDMVKEIKVFKDLVTDGEEEKGAGSTIERVFDMAVNSDIAKGFAAKVVGGMGNGAAEQQIPIGRPYRTPEGIFVNTGSAIVPWEGRKRKRGRAAPAAGPEVVEATATEEGAEQAEGAVTAAAPPAEAPDFIEGVDQTLFNAAVGMLETACRNNQPPEEVAASAKTMVPAPILDYIGRYGVDPLLERVARLPRSSPLMQQAGRNWVRKVAKALLGN